MKIEKISGDIKLQENDVIVSENEIIVLLKKYFSKHNISQYYNGRLFHGELRCGYTYNAFDGYETVYRWKYKTNED